jgi:UDP-N-acetylmuramyl pentapeptide phosphotransferase/UDP-N-acetylglucosamine-1-phosphate transferase
VEGKTIKRGGLVMLFFIFVAILITIIYPELLWFYLAFIVGIALILTIEDWINARKRKNGGRIW